MSVLPLSFLLSHSNIFLSHTLSLPTLLCLLLISYSPLSPLSLPFSLSLSLSLLLSLSLFFSLASSLFLLCSLLCPSILVVLCSDLRTILSVCTYILGPCDAS